MNPITTPQIIKIKTLCGKYRINSADLAYSYSDNRTESVSQLYINEAGELIKYLEKLSSTPQTSKIKMQRKILSLAHEMRWQKPYPLGRVGWRVDMGRVNNWCVQYGHATKPFNQYTEAELPKLVYQFEQAYKDYLKGV